MSLNDDKKSLLVDYSLSITTPDQSREAQELISSSPEAKDLYAKLQRALSPLDAFEAPPCPEYLSEKTVSLLCAAKEAQTESELEDNGHIQLQELLADEQGRKARASDYSNFWHNVGKVMVTAALFMIVAGIAGPTLKFVKFKHNQMQCNSQLAQIGRGIMSYKADHEQQLPQVAMPAGAAWWKIGDQNDTSHSNTRHIWLLVKQDYLDPAHFVCPGSKGSVKIKIDPSEIQKLRDFPDRKNITYSLQLICETSDINQNSPMPLMADLNPLFKKLPGSYQNPLNIRLSNKLRTANSPNHNQKGQNVLFSDGSVRFIKDRKMDVTNDDIFTLQGADIYRGIEVPTCQDDIFLAP